MQSGAWQERAQWLSREVSLQWLSREVSLLSVKRGLPAGRQMDRKGEKQGRGERGGRER